MIVMKATESNTGNKTVNTSIKLITILIIVNIKMINSNLKFNFAA